MNGDSGEDWKGLRLLSAKRAHGCATIKAIRPSGPSSAMRRTVALHFAGARSEEVMRSLAVAAPKKADRGAAR